MNQFLNTAKKTLDGLELPDMKGLQEMMGHINGGKKKKEYSFWDLIYND